MINFEAIIGIEVHVVLNTATKMFSPAPNQAQNATPNQFINAIDLGLPGTMPQVNEQAVQKALILADALNMQRVQPVLVFDRKHYFYQDLPKGFQITQQNFPIAQNGYVEIVENNKAQRIIIERFHLEEDTAKQHFVDGQILLDFNRCGAPLIEVVTAPVIKSAKQSKAYLQKLRQILIVNNISNAKLEDGSMRSDCNVSVRLKGQTAFGTKVEIKNINSLNNVEKAIDLEIARQVKALIKGEPVQQVTLTYDDKTNTNVFMRKKDNSVDYRYFIEPNIMSSNIDELLQKPNKAFNLTEFFTKLKEAGVNEQLNQLVVDDLTLFNAYTKINSVINSPQDTIRWLCIELMGQLNKLQKPLKDKTIDHLIILIQMVQKGTVNQKQAKQLIELMLDNGQDPQSLAKLHNLEQITDEKQLTQIIQQIFKENEGEILKNLDRVERIQKLIIGQVMQRTHNRANPQQVFIIVEKLLHDFSERAS
ncbi:Asp-tRNA(Asn)/Glu-tRNA(Gln) amidotransferase subunit GatB [Mycoplasmoides pneumoniae]|uniref:Aspartyl/glutamyl-tRNA(Asn/Gln) amidotransferase subunit B n=4 Tax=Mycoplasmoides pneumoniae TaxID=2104 RepID=GATB_MYCPN|nr:Asp-tRNA(Asn)/Glu-tRNA(Gln) amidotransferase subunit GatB [Mycoplasmoides pneumoniae]P75533.2 RecName: Full=Aspartyl/glutamyl-tRNA(Asn/Gln) amidotransferase subunit B; Short=Asp/Glu-ADT subunit B [Mycoplasmoides pneumoniae M129]ADK86854.1 GatB/GatE catalytic domain protein [Mycoplasmoides pneumoniae FH]AGC04163.1 aspartyl/glutamyl-tRNA amidotransferase subunit B [Mycoplasmoides pneumoniae M129-B7]ALA30121.1 aspartyl/glutamyl-tRNA amidotransferase subunit B [Mycoplasmoides pneumoniae PI 1428]